MDVAYDLSDYQTVSERITAFRDKHPEGSLQSGILHYPTEDLPFFVVVAQAYRTADDERPGTGLAQERYPGTTNFTRDSELQNCETSAVGRAIVNALAADTSVGIASQEEVRNSSGGQADRIVPPGRGAQASAPPDSSSDAPTPAQGASDRGASDREGGQASGDTSAAPSNLKAAVLARHGTIRAALEVGNFDKSWSELSDDELRTLLEED